MSGNLQLKGNGPTASIESAIKSRLGSLVRDEKGSNEVITVYSRISHAFEPSIISAMLPGSMNATTAYRQYPW